VGIASFGEFLVTIISPSALGPLGVDLQQAAAWQQDCPVSTEGQYTRGFNTSHWVSDSWASYASFWFSE
jgi:hypothetical protein